MAAKELYDYVDTVAADKDVTLSLDPQAVLTELGTKNDIIHIGDDGSEERIGLGGVGAVVPYITIMYDLLNASDAGTAMQFWYDSDYGDGRINSFKFTHPDGHTYVVRWDCDFERETRPTNYGVRTLRLKVLGSVAD